MIDEFDYKEPRCLSCGGKEFYYPDNDSPIERIPISRIIEKLDLYLNKNDIESAKAHLLYWEKEALSLKDLSGALTIVNELIGFYRKSQDEKNAFIYCDKANELIKKLNLLDSISSATILLNIATAKKAFNKAEEALPIYNQALSLYQKYLDSNDTRFSGLYNNMALALVDLNKFKKAEQYYLSAIKILQDNNGIKADIAISYINLAHLYEKMELKDKITDCLFSAYNILNDESNEKNGYFAYVLSKCYPSFEYFGFSVIAKELKKESEEIYARN